MSTNFNWKTILELSFNSSYWDTSSTPSLLWNWDIIEDLAWKKLASWSKLWIDNAWPRIINSQIFDVNNNAKFDKIEIIFSENLSSTTNNAFEINNILTWMNISWITTSWNKAIINLVESQNFDTNI